MMPSRAREFRSDLLAGVTAGVIALVVCAIGITWGLPNEERNRLYLQDERSLQVRLDRAAKGDLADTWRLWGPYSRSAAGRPPRSTYNAIRSDHPDEYAVLKVLLNVRPDQGRFDPKFYHIGGALIYPYGLLLFVLWKTGVIHLVPDIAHYMRTPSDMAALYLAGRWLCAAFAVAAVILVYDLGRRLFSRWFGLVAAVVLATLPAFALNAHFLYNDVPSAFWVTLCLWASLRFMDERKTWLFVLAAVAAGLAIGTKVSTALVVIPMMVAFSRGGASPGAAIGRSALALAIVLVTFAVTNPFAVANALTFGHDVASNMFINPAIAPYLAIVAKAINPGVACLAVMGMAVSVWRRDRLPRLLILAIWVAVIFAGACFFGKRYARYLVPMLPAVAVLAVTPALLLWRSGRRFVASLLVIAPLVLNVVWTASLLAALSRPNARLRAGAFILEEIPRRATILVNEDPWQYEMPAFDDVACDTRVIGYDADALARTPGLFVTSDIQRARSVVNAPEAAAFWDAFDVMVQAGSLRRVATFGGDQRLSGIDWNQGTFPEDFRYHNPVIAIYEGIGAVTPRIDGGVSH